jgi:hypothetical protein
MSRVRILEGIASDVRLVTPTSGGAGNYTATFKLGDPPERLTISGYALTEGEYVIAAVTPSIFQNLYRYFSRKPGNLDSVVAYTTLNARGKLMGIGADYVWLVLLYLFCACGLAISFLVMRGLVPRILVASDLMRSVQPVITKFHDITSALIALLSVALGYAGIQRQQTIRSAVSTLSTNNTVREAQERRTI